MDGTDHIGTKIGKYNTKSICLTITVIESIVALIEKGNYAKTAALASGVSKSSYYLWKQHGEKIRTRIDKETATIEDNNERELAKDAIVQTLTHYETLVWTFTVVLEQAEATAETTAVGKLWEGRKPKAGDKEGGSWRAALEYLRSRFKPQWGISNHVVIEDNRDTSAKDTQDTISSMSDQELAAGVDIATLASKDSKDTEDTEQDAPTTINDGVE